jgi:hypothetical protein
LPSIEVRDYTLDKEDTITTNATTPPSTDLQFQNPIALFTMELRSQTYTTSARKDLYYTAAEVAARISEEEDDDGSTVATDTEDDRDACFDADSEDDFDPESDEEDIRNMNMRD